MRHEILIGMGSNLGDRIGALRRAVVALRSMPETAQWRLSPVYETPPVNMADDDPTAATFLNAVAWAITAQSARAVFETLEQIEAGAGRRQKGDRRSRPLDLDLLAYGEAVFDEPAGPNRTGLRVPHPKLVERWFVLRPMADVAPNWRHPVLGRTALELLGELECAVASQTDTDANTDANRDARIGRGTRYAESLEPTG